MQKKKRKSLKSDSDIETHLDPERLPAHVGIIMDGNGRWAKKRLLKRTKGHERGSQAVRSIVTAATRLGIRTVTLYAFSTENWARPKAEIKALMVLLKKYIISERDAFNEHGIRLNVIGQKERLPEDVLRELDTSIKLTQHNDRILLNLALSYGAREEITRAVQAISVKFKNRELDLSDITSDLISDHLYTQGIPDPDLIIRTSGEYRLSNFLLWQAAYSEIYISPTLWPDFTENEFIEILKDFQNRDRRFGKV